MVHVQRLVPVTGSTGPPTLSPSAPISSPPPSSTPDAIPITTTTNTTPQYEPIDISRLIISNCELVHVLPIKLSTSIRDGRWTVHAIGGRRVFLSASGGSLQDAFEALHLKSAEDVDAYLARTPTDIGEYEEPSEDEESEFEDEGSDSDDEEDGDDEVSPRSFPQPYGCCGCECPGPRTRLLPIPRRQSPMKCSRVPLSSLPPPPPPPPKELPCPPPPPTYRLASSHAAPRPALLVISRGADEPRRVLTRVASSLQAIESAALSFVRESVPDSQPPAAAKVLGVGVGESERFEVDGFGDDLSEVFEKGIPLVYVDVRGPEGGGVVESGNLSLTRPLGGDNELKGEN